MAEPLEGIEEVPPPQDLEEAVEAIPYDLVIVVAGVAEGVEMDARLAVKGMNQRQAVNLLFSLVREVLGKNGYEVTATKRDG